MKKKAAFRFQGNQKEFMNIFHELCYSRQPWEAWPDVVTMMACSIANAADRTEGRHEKREKEYAECLKRVGSVEKPAQLLAVIVNALEEDTEQDFLGQMYMGLNLGNHWKGQIFTPYNVCRMMAEMNFGDGAKAEAESKGYLSVCDPCVGAGAMLIAAANAMRRAGINYQTSAVFAGQDVDRVAALMAYIQLSLLGCPGYIIVGDSLLHPPTGHVLFPQETEGQELWIMPMFQTDIWNMRRLAVMTENICGAAATKKPVEKERYFMFYNFKEQEAGNGREESAGCIQ